MADKVQDPELEDQELEVEVEELDGEELSFFERYRNLIIGGGALLAFLILGAIGYSVYQNSQNEEANSELFRAINAFENDSLVQAVRGGGQFLGFEEIADAYSGTAAADQANYYLGVAHLKSDSLDDAIGIEYLEKVGGSGNSLAMARDVALAFAYERQEDFDKAASLFEKAAYALGSNDATTPLLLMEAGRCYELAGEKSDALAAYETIKEDFPTSIEATRIDKNIARVSQ